MLASNVTIFYNISVSNSAFRGRLLPMLGPRFRWKAEYLLTLDPRELLIPGYNLVKHIKQIH